MTRKALIAKCNRRKLRALRQKANGQKITFSTRIYSQCIVTGRRRGVIGRFGLSRIEARKHINHNKIPQIHKPN